MTNFRNPIVLRKNCLLINLFNLLFWIGIRYNGSPYRFSITLSFDPHPKQGWINNQKSIPTLIDVRKK